MPTWNSANFVQIDEVRNDTLVGFEVRHVTAKV